MSELRAAVTRRAPRGFLRAALLCAIAAAVLEAGSAGAQDGGSTLRGEVAEDDVKNELLAVVPLSGQKMPLDDQKAKAPQAEDDGIPAPVFRPVSEGAIPEEAAEGEASRRKSIFAEDIDEADGAAIGRPSTAQQREQARKRENEPAESASTRLARERRETQAEGEEEVTTGTVRAGTIDSETQLKTAPESEREAAIESLNKEPEENPYAPVGLRMGTFTVYPSAESGVTWTSNADSSSTGGPATLSETMLRLNAISEHGGDKTTIEGFGTFRKTISGDEIDETRGGARAALERDLAGDWRGLASLSYEFGPESASSPDAIVGVPEQPIEHTIEGSLGVEKDVGKLQLRLTGNVERNMFDDAELSTGGSISQADRNSTLGAVVLRTGYEISPALTPFIEAEYGRRIYDQEFDSGGFDRSSTRTGVRGGIEVDLGEKFRGEAAGGWIEEDIDDSRLAAVSGPWVGAAFDWSPVRGTVVGFDAETTVEDATTPGESGSILYSGKVTLERELRANLTGELAFGGELRDYTGEDGRDTIWNAEASLTWWLNRYVGVTSRASYEQLESTLPGRDYETKSVFLGLKLQR